MVMITARAAAKALELLAAENDPALTACASPSRAAAAPGFQYALGFDGAPSRTTRAWELHGVRVIVDRPAWRYWTVPAWTTWTGCPAPVSRSRTPTWRRLRLRHLVPGEDEGRSALPDADAGAPPTAAAPTDRPQRRAAGLDCRA